MRIKGYEQKGYGNWVAFERKVNPLEWLKHKYYSWYTIINYKLIK